MKRFYCFLIYLCPALSPGQGLQQGDKVPDVKLSILNANYKQVQLSSFHDQLLIVDFWATWCGSCIHEFPKLDSLQRQFTNRIQILLVNNPKSGDDEKKLIAFFNKKRTPSGDRYTFPVGYHDEILAGYFPHQTIPHTVWIFQGKVVAITQPSGLTATNIESVLSGKMMHAESKADNMAYDLQQPFMNYTNTLTTDKVLYSSLFTRYLQGISPSVVRMPLADSLLKRSLYINKPILRLYGYAYPEIVSNRMMVDSSLLPELITTTQDLDWRMAHFYTYEQTVPIKTPIAQQLAFMRQDIDRQFGLHSRIAKRLVHCWVLRTKNPARIPVGAPTATSHSLKKLDNGEWVLDNCPIDDLIVQLNTQPLGMPFRPVVIDESGYAGAVQMPLHITNIYDLQALRNCLQSFGLELTEEDRTLDLLIISTLN